MHLLIISLIHRLAKQTSVDELEFQISRFNFFYYYFPFDWSSNTIHAHEAFALTQEITVKRLVERYNKKYFNCIRRQWNKTCISRFRIFTMWNWGTRILRSGFFYITTSFLLSFSRLCPLLRSIFWSLSRVDLSSWGHCKIVPWTTDMFRFPDLCR